MNKKTINSTEESKIFVDDTVQKIMLLLNNEFNTLDVTHDLKYLLLQRIINSLFCNFIHPMVNFSIKVNSDLEKKTNQIFEDK